MSSSESKSSSLCLSSVVDLCRRLRREHLVVQHEKEALLKLSQDVRQQAEQLAENAYLSRHQRLLLTHLQVHGGRDHLGHLRAPHFEQAHRSLGPHEPHYRRLLQQLRVRPVLLAQCLLADESDERCEEVEEIVFASLLGCGRVHGDEALLFQLLEALALHQLNAGSARKRLRAANCAFARLYRSLTEELFLAKLFLTSALYDGILGMLSQDEIFVDVDPSKALLRFSPAERAKKFGEEGSSQFEQAMSDHRKYVVSKLESFSRTFIEGIANNLHCFPPILAHLLFTVHSCVDKKEGPNEAMAVCVDMLFDLFICPAMVDPNPVGIIDTPVSYVARSNLMQVAQTLQTLALSRWESIDSRFKDLYSRFNPDCMVTVIETILKTGEALHKAHASKSARELSTDDPESFLDEGMSEESIGSNFTETLPISKLTRLSIMLTASQLETLIVHLRVVSNSNEKLGSQLEDFLQCLPSSLPSVQNGLKRSESSSSLQDRSSSHRSGTSKKQALANKFSLAINRETRNHNPNKVSHEGNEVNEDMDVVLVFPLSEDGSLPEPPGFLSEEVVLAREGKRQRTKDAADKMESDMNTKEASGKRTRFSISQEDEEENSNSEDDSNHSVDSSVGTDNDHLTDLMDPIIDNLSDMVSANVSGRGTPNVSGRDTPSSQDEQDDHNSRRSSNQPQEDNNEGNVGNAIINRNNNNNGLPIQNVNNHANAPQSGNLHNNDSLGTSNEHGAVNRSAPTSNRQRPNACSRVAGHRPRRQEDLEDKFGRFEIKTSPSSSSRTTHGGPSGVPPHVSSAKGLNDETVSMISDTWSTEVAASDTETENVGRRPSDMDERVRNRILDELEVPQGEAGSSVANLLDLTDAGSEAWSIDVMASDSESTRMGEVDIDDAASVARSDDTRLTDDTARSDPDSLLADVFGPRRALVSARQPSAEDGVKSSSSLARRGSDSSGIGGVLEGLNRANVNHARRLESSSGNSILKKSSKDIPVKAIKGEPQSPPSSNPNEAAATGQLAPQLSAQSLASSLDEAEVAPRVSSKSSTVEGSTASTGAIPKSISFDKKVYFDREQQQQQQQQGAEYIEALSAFGRSKVSRESKSAGNFFKSLKLPKLGPKLQHMHQQRRLNQNTITTKENDGSAHDEGRHGVNISSDDILAKYQAKAKVADLLELDDSNEKENDVEDNDEDAADGPIMINGPPTEGTFLFQDAKRKLRLVLSEVSVEQLLSSSSTSLLSSLSTSSSSVLTLLLRVLLSEGLNLQDRVLVARLHETLRCLSTFDAVATRQLVRSLRHDLRHRVVYWGYLARCRQNVLISSSQVQRLSARAEAERQHRRRHWLTVYIRFFLERNDSVIQRFLAQFRSLDAADEKTALVEKFLKVLYQQLSNEEELLRSGSLQLIDVEENLLKAIIERLVIGLIYVHAMYPNGEADVARDRVLHNHIEKLAKIVGPGHKYLKIHNRYHCEQPWPSAQAEIRRLGAFKTAGEKVGCVSRCCQTIMNLLSMAAKSKVVAADDFLPVLIFVVIKANPPGLLSTVQYVEAFGQEGMGGEDHYWWMQFVNAIEYIKIMDY